MSLIQQKASEHVQFIRNCELKVQNIILLTVWVIYIIYSEIIILILEFLQNLLVNVLEMLVTSIASFLLSARSSFDRSVVCY